MRRVTSAIAGCAGACALLSLISVSARAATPREARLEYSRGPGAEHCPDEETLRSAVSTRLGYDPFRTDAPRTITAAIARAGHSLNAVVKLLDASGNVTGKRDLTSTQNDCSELVGAMTLAISIAIDPQSELRGPGSPAPPVPSAPPTAEAPAPPEPPAEPPSPPPSPSRRTPSPPGGPGPGPGPGEKAGASDGEGAPPPEPPRLQAHAGLAGLMTLGTSPGVSAGLAAVAGLRFGAASIGLEGRADLPTSMEAVGGGIVTASILLGTLTPCYHYEALLMCAVVSAGVLRGSGARVDETREATTLFAAAGGRIGVELLKPTPISARFFVDSTATLTPTSLELNDREVWRTSPVGIAVGIAGLAHFL